tara:strand:- start:1472 stop:1678 length:207 start_codon:yes stop_codon:yes gene_type:complete
MVEQKNNQENQDRPTVSSEDFGEVADALNDPEWETLCEYAGESPAQLTTGAACGLLGMSSETFAKILG